MFAFSGTPFFPATARAIVRQRLPSFASGWLPIGLAITVLTAGWAVCDDQVPETKCIIRVQASQNARITLNGKAYGLQRRFEFGPLSPGRLYRSKLIVDLPDSGRLEKTLLVQGGQSVIVPVTSNELPEPVPQTGNPGNICSAVISHDNRHALTASLDRSVILWSVTTGRQLRTFRGFAGYVSAVAISSDSRWVLFGCIDGTSSRWSLRSGEHLRTYEKQRKAVRYAAFSADGSHIVTQCDSDPNTLKGPEAVVRDTETGTTLHTFVCKHPTFLRLRQGDRERLALAGAKGNDIVLWDLDTGQQTDVLNHQAPVHSIFQSVNRARLVSGIWDHKQREGAILVWDPSTGQRIQSCSYHGDFVQKAAINVDGDRVYGHCGNAVIVWDVATGNELQRISVSHQQQNSRPVNSNDSLWVDLESKSARVFIAQSGRDVVHFKGHCRNVTGVCVSTDGDRILIGSSDQGHNYSIAPWNAQKNSAVMWDTVTGEKTRLFTGADAYPAWKVALRSDGKKLLAASGTGIEFWDVETGEKERRLDRSDYSWALAVSRNRVLSSSGSRVVVSDAETARTVSTFSGHSDELYHASLSADGFTALTAQYGHALLWDTRSGEIRKEFTGTNGSQITSIAVSSDGELAAIASDSKVILWDSTSGREFRSIEETGDLISSIAFSPDARYLVTASHNNVATLWNARTGTRLRQLVGHDSSLTDVCISSDMRFIVTASADGTARVWDVCSGDELLQIIPIDGGNEWVVVTPEGLFDGSEIGLQRMMFRIGNGLNVVPITRFFQDFYRAGLLARIWNGERPMPSVDMSGSVPPTITLISPESGEATGPSSIELLAEVKDNGSGVQGPFLWHNGARILARPEITPVNQNTKQYKFTVSLLDGHNQLRVAAATADGAWESEPSEITLTHNSSLPRPDLYVLAIGIDDYAQESLKLACAAADATAMARLFRDRGYAFYERVNVIQLLNERATKLAIRSSLRDIAEKARAHDTVFVHFSGHGHTIGQRYYFIPAEFRLKSDHFENDVTGQGLPGDQIFKELARSQARKRMLVLDTCHSGAALQKSEFKHRDPFAFAGTIRRLSRSEGIFTIAACSASGRTSDIHQLGHGVLTWALLQGGQAESSSDLSSADGNNDGVINVSEWFGFASATVPRLTKQHLGYEQDVHQQSVGVSFPLLPVRAGEPPR